MASPSPSSSFESLFHGTTIDLFVPESSHLPCRASSDEGAWWKNVRAVPSRNVSFLDEKLFYFVVISIPDSFLEFDGEDDSSTPRELLRLVSRLQVTMNASFVPPLPPTRPHPSLTMSTIPTQDSTSTLNTLSTTQRPATPDGGATPLTPNPFPSMDEGDSQYASVEGVTVWDGSVEELEEEDGLEGEKRTMVIRGDGRWEVIWRGHVPISYVRTQIPNPMLSLTASITLRDDSQRRHKSTTSLGGLSITSGADTVHDDEVDHWELAEMEEVDLLGGLAGDVDSMPTTRLAPSIRQDLSLAPPPFSAVPMTAITPSTAAQPTPSTASAPTTAGPSRERGHIPTQSMVPPQSPTTLRKSFRRVLSLSTGLRVRMRTLFLPQLLPPRGSTMAEEENEGGSEGELRVVLCVEVENSVEGELAHGFEVERINIDVGGKGGKAAAELVCQPEQSQGVFPLRLQAVEQYNLLYAVNIASTPEDRSGQGVEDAVARTLGKGDEQRPVAIIVIGRPFSQSSLGQTVYPTKTFHSRWNCTLDLSPFYASLANSTPQAQLQSGQNRLSKPVPTPPNAIMGDKRYSLASLLSHPNGGPGSGGGGGGGGPSTQQRIVSAPTQRPVGSRVLSMRPPPSRSMDGQGLLLSVKVLSASPESSPRINPLEPFSIEVFVHNRTEEVKRFRLSVPGREEWVGRVREMWEKRRRRSGDEPHWGVDDPVLRTMLLQHLSSTPALVPLEDDVRCGPLLPGASMAARMRFLPLRKGVHALERLRVTGANEEFDFVMSPVPDVVVGDGVDEH